MFFKSACNGCVARCARLRLHPCSVFSGTASCIQGKHEASPRPGPRIKVRKLISWYPKKYKAHRQTKLASGQAGVCNKSLAAFLGDLQVHTLDLLPFSGHLVNEELQMTCFDHCPSAKCLNRLNASNQEIETVSLMCTRRVAS